MKIHQFLNARVSFFHSIHSFSHNKNKVKRSYLFPVSHHKYTCSWYGSVGVKKHTHTKPKTINKFIVLFTFVFQALRGKKSKQIIRRKVSNFNYMLSYTLKRKATTEKSQQNNKYMSNPFITKTIKQMGRAMKELREWLYRL